MYVERIMEYALQTFVENYLHRKEKRVGLSMMCYTLGKEKRTCLGDFQLSGLIGKLLY